jgi:hypothetical protein
MPVTGTKPTGSGPGNEHVPLAPVPVPEPLCVPVPVPVLVLLPVLELDPVLVPVLDPVVTPVELVLQKPACVNSPRTVMQVASFPPDTVLSQPGSDAAGSVGQHAVSWVHAGPPLPPPESFPPVAVLDELLQAAAVMEAAKKTGMAKRYRLAFMAGHHTRRTDPVKNVCAILVTKTYTRRPRAPWRPA